MKAVVALIALAAGASAAYNRDAAVSYAKTWWDKANHDCSSGFEDCTPYAYYGGEHCDYGSHGGDCADFVSQCLLAGGHTPLNQGGSCRGYPCGKEEVGAKNLGDCLAGTHGWTRTCGYHQPPPDNIIPGDVLVYHSDSCDGYSAHAVLVVSGGSNPTIACHSTSHYGIDYNYMAGTHDYYEWLHKD